MVEQHVRVDAAALDVVGLLGAGDTGSTRLVYAMVIGLVVVGVALVTLAIWILRQTRPEPALLAPLERMGERRWRRHDEHVRRQLLDEVRPMGAQLLEASGVASSDAAMSDQPLSDPAG